MNSLFQDFKENLTEKVTGRKKTPRDKFVVVPSEVPATIPSLRAIEPTSKKEETMATKNPFSYHTGSGKENKAEYRIGKASVPAAVISRLEKEVAGKPETKKGFIIYGKLEKRYSKFLEALDVAELDYVAALGLMKEVKPKKAAGTGQRTGKVEKTAEALAKSVCKRFKGTPEKIVEAFATLVGSSEFQSDLKEIISVYQKDFGTTTLGYTKTSNRKANPAAMKALEKFRKGKK